MSKHKGFTLFVVISLGLYLLAVYFCLKPAIQYKQYTGSAEAVVIDIEVTKDRSRDSSGSYVTRTVYLPVIQYTANDEILTVTVNDKQRKQPEVGSTLLLHYDVNDTSQYVTEWQYDEAKFSAGAVLSIPVLVIAFVTFGLFLSKVTGKYNASK